MNVVVEQDIKDMKGWGVNSLRMDVKNTGIATVRKWCRCMYATSIPGYPGRSKS
jgi:hypothetical protein